MNGYDLSRQWFDFAFENRQCKVQHTALYMWIIELNNRLGWKSEFGLPTNATMEGLGIGNRGTYSKTLGDLAEWKFIEIIQESKNQYQSCIIKLCLFNNEQAERQALDQALIRHSINHCTDIESSTAPIDKQRNKETRKQINIDFDVFWNAYDKKVDRTKAEKKWSSLTDSQRELAIADIPKYLASLRDRQFQKNPLTYLNGECWKDEREVGKPVIKLEHPEPQRRYLNDL